MAIDGETSRLMLNWAAWRVSGGSLVIAQRNGFDIAARDAWDTPIPLINGEAIEVDQAIERLEPHLRQATEEFWLMTNPVQDKVRRCGCGSPAALYRRLDQAHAFIRAFRRELIAKAERARAAYSRSEVPKLREDD